MTCMDSTWSFIFSCAPLWSWLAASRGTQLVSWLQLDGGRLPSLWSALRLVSFNPLIDWFLIFNIQATMMVKFCGENMSCQITSKNLFHHSCHIHTPCYVWRRFERNEVEGHRKVDIKMVEFQSVGEACLAMFWATPGFKREMFWELLAGSLASLTDYTKIRNRCLVKCVAVLCECISLCWAFHT